MIPSYKKGLTENEKFFSKCFVQNESKFISHLLISFVCTFLILEVGDVFLTSSLTDYSINGASIQSFPSIWRVTSMEATVSPVAFTIVAGGSTTTPIADMIGNA